MSILLREVRDCCLYYNNAVLEYYHLQLYDSLTFKATRSLLCITYHQLYQRISSMTNKNSELAVNKH